MEIVPAILVLTFKEFENQARRLEGIFDLAQIDVMDGVFVKNKSFEDVTSVNDLKININFELHLMAERPLEELQKWEKVKNIKRAIFHIESKNDPIKVIARIRELGWEAGIALNPETKLETAEPYFNLIDAVLFMTVRPGNQGAKFLPEMEEKIKRFTVLNRRPLCVVDGGINTETIAMVKSWGVDAVNIGSAISAADDVNEVLEKLKSRLLS